MSDSKPNEPSWKKFSNFEGPDEDERTKALRQRRRAEGHGGNEFGSLQSGGDLQWTSPRHYKHKKTF